MGRGRILILGIDGLEYNLVEEYRLSSIKQKSYSKLDLSDFMVIVTPPIWGSMLTGNIDESVIDRFIERSKIVGMSKEKTWAKIFAKILPQKIKDFADKKNLIPNPFDESANYINEKKYTNIFDFYNKSWHNGIPGLGRNVSNMEIKLLVRHAVEGESQPYIEKIKDIYLKDKSDLLEALRQDFDLIFWYTDFLDKAGHIYISKKIKIMKYYMEINRLVHNIKNHFRDSIIYIISDHGMEDTKESWGKHSNHGFFSSSDGKLIKKPQELFYLIKDNI